MVDEGADVSLEPADHDRAELLDAADRDAAGEALGVEDLQKGGEAVAMAVVGGRREEQAIFEARSDAVADDAGDLRVDGVAAVGCGGGWGDGVGLVEDQQGFSAAAFVEVLDQGFQVLGAA